MSSRFLLNKIKKASKPEISYILEKKLSKWFLIEKIITNNCINKNNFKILINKIKKFFFQH